MTDKELIRLLMYKKEWKQIDVARYLRVQPSKITRVLQETEGLHPSSRKLLEMLLEEEKEYS